MSRVSPSHHRAYKAQTFVFKLAVNAIEQFVLPSPLSFAMQAIKDFKEVYGELPEVERAALASEIAGNSAKFALALEARLKQENYWTQKINSEEFSILTRVIFEVLNEAPSAERIIERIEPRVPSSWRMQEAWHSLQSQRSSESQRTARRALAQTWLTPLERWGEDTQESLIEGLPPPELEGLFVHPTLLGRGARSIVYHASPHHQRWLDLLAQHKVGSVALKVGYLESPTRFEREVEVMRSTWDQSLCPALDAGILEGQGSLRARYWIAMPNYGGLTLEHLIRQKTSLEAKLEVMRTCLDGLCALHTQGVAHRDVKPANILVTNTLEAKLSDFGLARSVSSPVIPSHQDSNQEESSLTALFLEATQTRMGEPLGTPAYMSPEQLSSSQSVTVASDLWSFGAVLYEVITEERLFSQESIPEVWGAILHTPLALDHPRIPAELMPMLQACLQRDLKIRPGSALELNERFRSVLEAVIQAERFERYRKAWIAVLKQEWIPHFTQSILERREHFSDAQALLSEFQNTYPLLPELDENQLKGVLWKYFQAQIHHLKAQNIFEEAERSLAKELEEKSLKIDSGVQNFAESMNRQQLIEQSDLVTEHRKRLTQEADQAIAHAQNLKSQAKKSLHQAKHTLERVLPNALKHEYPDYQAWRQEEDRRSTTLMMIRTQKSRIMQMIETPALLLKSDLEEERVDQIGFIRSKDLQYMLMLMTAPTVGQPGEVPHVYRCLFEERTPSRSDLKQAKRELEKLSEHFENSSPYMHAAKVFLASFNRQHALYVQHLEQEVRSVLSACHMECQSTTSLDQFSNIKHELEQEEQQTQKLLERLLNKQAHLEERFTCLSELFPDASLQASPTTPTIANPSRTSEQHPSPNENLDVGSLLSEDAESSSWISHLFAFALSLLSHPGVWLSATAYEELEGLGGLWPLLCILVFLRPSALFPTLFISASLLSTHPPSWLESQSFSLLTYTGLDKYWVHLIPEIKRWLPSLILLILSDAMARILSSEKPILTRFSCSLPSALGVSTFAMIFIRSWNVNPLTIQSPPVLFLPYILAFIPFGLALSGALKGHLTPFLLIIGCTMFISVEWSSQLGLLKASWWLVHIDHWLCAQLTLLW